MGRSVSYPSDAVVAFSSWDNEDGSFWFDEEVIQPFADQVKRLFPSAESCNEWIGREDHAIMSNAHVYFGVSEYCGLVAYWAVVRGDCERPELAEQWLGSIEAKFQKNFGSLEMIVRASNGEAFFRSIAA